MRTNTITSGALTLALISFLIFQGFTADEENSPAAALWINGKVHQYSQCPQSVVQPGAYYVITNITKNKVVGSGYTDAKGNYHSTSTQGTQGGDIIRVSATYQNKVGCVRFVMPSGDAHVNVCIDRNGNVCPDEG